MTGVRWLLPAQALFAGLLHALALSRLGPGTWELQILAQAWLAVLVARAATSGKAAWIGWIFASAWLSASVWWLYISMHDYGGLPAVLAALAVLALCMAIAVIYAAAMALARWSAVRGWLEPVAFALAWLLAELVRGTLFTGFPWAASGYAHADGPLASLAPWVGVYGMGAVAAFVAACLALVLGGHVVSLRERVAALAVGIAVLLVGLAPVHDFTRPTGSLGVTLLQGDVPQEMKFDPRHIGEALAWHAQALASVRNDLVIAPETAVPLPPQYLPLGVWQALERRFATGQSAALIGIPLGNDELGYANSMIGLAPGAAAMYRYDKHHLVPWGEFVPWGFHWFVAMMNIPLGDFNRGPVDAPSFVWRGQRIAPNICYEDLFGEELAQRFVDGSRAPTILANASNLGWFGNTSIVAQHLQISRLRALEFQRPVVRATNTGATAIIGHDGRVERMLAPYTRGVLVGTVQGRDGLTPYARWAGAYGLWPLALLALAGLALVRWRRRAA